MYKIGDPVDYLYISKHGEFEMLKECESEPDQDINAEWITADHTEKEYFKTRRSKSLAKRKFMINVSLITQGQLFGERDFILQCKTPKDSRKVKLVSKYYLSRSKIIPSFFFCYYYSYF